jgi:hypothetical protein
VALLSEAFIRACQSSTASPWLSDYQGLVNKALTKQLAAASASELFTRGATLADTGRLRVLTRLVAGSVLAVETEVGARFQNLEQTFEQLATIGTAIADEIAATAGTGTVADVQALCDSALDNEWPRLSRLERLVILKFVSS